MSKYIGPILSLIMYLGMTALTLCFSLSKLPLLAPIVTSGIAIVYGVMVVSDWKDVWRPLLTGKPTS
jgi:hypothetical protein